MSNEIRWKSDEPEDQTAQAVATITEAVHRISEHYTDQTVWPGWSDDAQQAVRMASRLLSMAQARALAGGRIHE